MSNNCIESIHTYGLLFFYLCFSGCSYILSNAWRKTCHNRISLSYKLYNKTKKKGLLQYRKDLSIDCNIKSTYLTALHCHYQFVKYQLTLNKPKYMISGKVDLSNQMIIFSGNISIPEIILCLRLALTEESVCFAPPDSMSTSFSAEELKCEVRMFTLNLTSSNSLSGDISVTYQIQTIAFVTVHLICFVARETVYFS